MKGAGPFGFFWILLDLGEELGITKPLVLATPGHITKASYERGPASLRTGGAPSIGVTLQFAKSEPGSTGLLGDSGVARSAEGKQVRRPTEVGQDPIDYPQGLPGSSGRHGAS